MRLTTATGRYAAAVAVFALAAAPAAARTHVALKQWSVPALVEHPARERRPVAHREWQAGRGRGELRPVVPLAALDLLELGDDLTAGGRDVARHRLALRVKAEAGASLPLGAHAVV